MVPEKAIFCSMTLYSRE